MRSSLSPPLILAALTLGACAPAVAPRPAALPPASAMRVRGDELPGGIRCLLRLQQLGIAHEVRPALAGVLTPVELQGPVAGVTLAPTSGRRPLICDCRLLLALHRAAPVWRAHGVQLLYYSSGYRRPAGSGPLGRHAMGLALDVHRLRAAGALLSVADDFATGHAGEACEAAPGPLNAIACELRARGLFDRVLTPDTDAAHRDHLHLEVLSLERRRRPPSRRLPSPVITD